MKKPYVIAEIGVNYYDIAKCKSMSNLNAAKLMIKKAKESGADAVKFQTYKAEKLASKNSPSYWDISEEPTSSQYELFKKYDQFGESEYIELAEYCKKLDVDFLSTPFDLEAVDFLDVLVKYFKVASADITNYPLLRKVASKGKPMFLSTGAATVKEIRSAIDLIKRVDHNIIITLLHCVLSYPTKYGDANLNRIKLLKDNFPNCNIGYSDHTRPDESMLTLILAKLFGADIIEKHFTLDKSLKGNDHYHAMDPKDLKKFKSNLNLVAKLLSKNQLNYLSCEEVSRKQARRSIVLNKDLSKGDIITFKDVIMKRPGNGISPMDLDKVIGRKVKKNLFEDDLLDFGNLI